MTTTFKVRDREYRLEVTPAERPEGEKFELYRATVSGQEGGPVSGTLKLTTKTLEQAREKAVKDGDSAEQWLARACGRSLASELLIRRLKPDFSFVVDHRWV
jgi:hypothetical protein